MSKEKLSSLRVRYTNNCTKIGEFMGQIKSLQNSIEAMVQENTALSAEHTALSKIMEEAKAEAAAEAKPVAVVSDGKQA
jgi:regulator of replication initiation timing